jgi:hypothetical protein
MAIVSRNKFLFVLLVLCFGLNAQDKLSDIFEKLFTGTYYSNYEASLEFRIVNDKLVYDYSVVKEATYPIDKQSYSWAQSVTYSEYYTSNVKLRAEVLLMKRPGHYKTIKIDHFAKKNVTSEGIFYEDQIQESFYMPTTRPGTISRLYFSYTGNDPMLTSRMLFNMEIPADRITYKVIIPDDVKARFVFVGDTAGVVQTEKRIKEKSIQKTVYTYSTTGRKAIVFEDDAEDLTYYTPHLFILPVSYTVAGKEIKAGGNLENLFTYYNKHVKAIKESDNAELNHVTDSLVANVTDTLTKIKIIYGWVQKHIKYVAFEEGPNGFIPRPASKIFANRYGDCKDKTNILINMLERAKIKANYSWIGTRHKPYSYEQLPSPHADNHMIVSLQYKGRWTFLDATALAAEFDYPSSFIQGKEALIRLSDSSFTVQQIPIVEAKRSRKVDSLFLRIEKDEIVGYGTQKTSGYFKEDYNNILLNALNSENSLKKEIDFGNNKLSVADFKVNTEEDKDLTLQYQFKLSNYLQTYDKDMYLNLNLIKDMDKRAVLVDERKHGITNDYKYELVQHIQLDLPPDKSVDGMPADKFFSNDSFSFEIKYEKKNNKVIYQKKIVINHLLLKTESFKDWNEMVENLNKAYTEAIIIKSK